MTGQTISHYRITGKLGEGGMGVVYKAEDTKLERTVALKFLAAHLVSDEEIRKRFEREAKAAAALNHPNICHVYEIDEADGKTFIAMAFIEGQGLDEKIAAGPLKLDEALDIAHQIAQGLQAAHEKGIVHRDIKPANVMITGSGSRRQLTIMDFGLAQLTEHSKLTRMDETMGTVAYMSPEQTMGAEVDRRSDIWALGVVLYEMITGQRPFKGHYDKAVMYSITNEEPEPITALRTGVPMELEWIAGKCLAKETDSRYQNAGELAVDLKNLQEKLKSGRSTILRTSAPPSVGARPGPVSGAESAVGARHAVPGGGGTEMGARAQHAVPLRGTAAAPTWKRYLPWALFAGSALAALALAFLHFREAPPPQLPLRKFAFTPSAAIPTLAADEWRANLAISPDGRHIAFAIVGQNTTRQLWVQDLDQPQPRLIAGGDGAIAPFWSPDSSYIGFATENELRRVSVQGGASSRVCELPADFLGGTWSPDGELIVFSAGRPYGVLYDVPSSGGTVKPVLLPEAPEGRARQQEEIGWPHFLPAEAGPRLLVYADSLAPGEQTLMVHDLATGRREELGTGSFPVYASSGHLVFQSSLNNYDLLAAPFSLKSLQFTGERFPIRENAGRPSVARDGTLVYLESSGTRMKQMVWRDRRGAKIGTIGQPQLGIEMPELSPDGRQVLVRSPETGNYDIWVHDVARGVKQRLTFDPAQEDRPIWLPKGDRISFSSNRRGEGGQDIYVQSADGTGEAQPLLASPASEYAYDWSADEKYVIFNQSHQQMDLYYLKRKDDGSGYDSVPFVSSPFDLLSPKLSPDGKYLSYESNESGRYEVYVQPFPQSGGKVQLSANGGRQPRWRGDGKELFYVVGNALVAVPVTTAGGFSAGEPQQLFEATPGVSEGRGHRYTVTPDGQKFILVEDADGDDAAVPAIQVTQNWFAEFQGQQR